METYTIFDLVDYSHLGARIVQTMTCTETELMYWLTAINAGASSYAISYLVGNYSEEGGYVKNVGGTFSYSAYPTKPSIYHKFDYITATWIEDESIFTEQLLVKEKALRARYSSVSSFFYYNNPKWSIDTHQLTDDRLSLFRAFIAYVEANSVLPSGWPGWFDYYEYYILPLQATVAEELVVAKEMLVAAESRLLRCTAVFYNKMQELHSLTTIADLLVFDINSGWPTT